MSPATVNVPIEGLLWLVVAAYGQKPLHCKGFYIFTMAEFG